MPLLAFTSVLLEIRGVAPHRAVALFIPSSMYLPGYGTSREKADANLPAGEFGLDNDPDYLYYEFVVYVLSSA